jgi:hypothetical protein
MSMYNISLMYLAPTTSFSRPEHDNLTSTYTNHTNVIKDTHET